MLIVRYLMLVAAVVVLNFALPRVLPGDPLSGRAQAGAPPLSAEQEAQLRLTYRLDEPLPDQFSAYLLDVAHGDLGWSISRGAPVSRLVAERLPWTLALVLTSVVLAGLGGGALGMIAAWRGGAWDRFGVALGSSVAALPEFLIAMLLLLTLAVGAGWFPISGGQSPFGPRDQGWWAAFGDKLLHLVLPAATLVIANLAAFVLLTRGAVTGVLREPYLATARAKGLGEWRVALQHAVPNAVLPVLTEFGIRVGQLVGGAIVVERVYAIPGLGLLAFQAIQTRDYPVLQATFLLGSLAVLLANLLVELAYRRLAVRT